MANYLDDFLGKGASGSVVLAAGESKRLPSRPCKFVKLFNWNSSHDELFTITTDKFLDQNNEVYYGFDGSIVGQLFQTQSTDWIPVSNTDQIFVRNTAKSPATTILFAWLY